MAISRETLSFNRRNRMRIKGVRFLFAASLILAAGLTIFSCKAGNKSSDQTAGKNVPEKKSGPLIGFSIDTLAIERWQRDLDVFMARAKELGADVIVQNAGNSSEEQAKQIAYLSERDVDVLVVLPKDSLSLTECLEKVQQRGIPVISYDRLILQAPVSLYMTIDSEQVGAFMAKEMLGRTSAKSWYCILGPQEDNNMEMILSGFEPVIKEKGIKIEEIFYTEGWNYDKSRQKMVDLMADGIIPEVIVCGNDAIADSVINALIDFYPERRVHICGQDADIAACQNIVRGRQDFTIYKPIGHLARLTAETAVSIAKGTKPAEISEITGSIDNGYTDVPAIKLEPEVVDAHNMDEVIIGSGFHTRNEVYR